MSPMLNMKIRSARKKVLAFLLLSSTLAARTVLGGEIVLPSPVLERDAPIQVVYKIPWPATGSGELSIRWTDVYGRVVEDRKVPFALRDEFEVSFQLDLRRAVAMQNELRVHFSFNGVNKKGEHEYREEDAKVSFIARPPDRTWWDYAIIMWQEQTAEQYALLKTLGINAAAMRMDQLKHLAESPLKDSPASFLKNDLRWYVENIATDFYSEYHRWFPDRPVNWKFSEAKALYKEDSASRESFKRQPSLSDPEWLQKIHDRLVESARWNAPYRPLFYDLGDETGIADLAAFWDFDFSDQSLAGMRVWLKGQYATLTALNQQWGTGFLSWNSVTPMTTNEAMKRTDDNFSSWADFKTWMDVSYARALKVGVDAIHSVDPGGYVAIEGAQAPGWGGYDYARLSNVLTAIELYDSGANVEILRSLNPQMVTLITSGGSGPREKWRIWYELLHGNRGLIIWDEKSGFTQKDGALGVRALETASFYNELRSGIAALLINSEGQSDPIAIHYSQPSQRTEWMLDQRPKGEAWVERTSASEEGSNFQRLRESYCRLVEDLGLQYRFVSYDQVEQGALLRGGYRILILPQSTSLSQAEANAMRQFVEQGGVLIADGEPGTFDEHSRRLAKPLLSELFGGLRDGPVTTRPFGRGKAIYLADGMLNYYRDRLMGKEQPALQLMGKFFKENGVNAEFRVTETSGEPAVGVELHSFRNGGASIVGLLSNPQLFIEDLGPPEVISNRRFEKPRTVLLTFPGDFYVYDIRAAKAMGKGKQFAVQLDPYEPVIYSVSPLPFPTLALSAPAGLRRGQDGQLGLRLSGDTPAAIHVFHVDVLDPTGKVAAYYSGNVLALDGRAYRPLPLAFNDRAGTWSIRVRDLLTGQTQSAFIEVF